MTCNNNNFSSIKSNNNCSSNCVDEFNCDNSCPDFQIKRYDTKPSFKVAISNCDGPIDLTGLVLEASMWANAKLKTSINDIDTFFALADNVGFQQALVGDIIVMDRIRNPEQMLITGFDETLNFIQVQRGYNGSPTSGYRKGTSLKIFRVLNAVAQTELTYEDQLQVDGTVKFNILIKSELVYEWSANDTCLPGCYSFEFKLLHMSSSMGMVGALGTIVPSAMSVPSVLSFTSFTPSQDGCSIGAGVSWVRRFPPSGAFLIQITPSPTSENLLVNQKHD